MSARAWHPGYQQDLAPTMCSYSGITRIVRLIDLRKLAIQQKHPVGPVVGRLGRQVGLHRITITL